MQAMTIAIILATVALAGCTTAETPGATLDPATIATPVPDRGPDLEGVLWLPVSLGMEPGESDIGFLVDTSAATLRVHLYLGWTVAPSVPAPASAMVDLVAPDGTQAASAMFPPGGTREGEMVVEDAAPGPWLLRVESWGGSDGEANGDYLAYTVTAKGER